MKIKFRVDGKEINYTEEELNLLPRYELKQIIRDIQLNIDEVSSKLRNNVYFEAGGHGFSIEHYYR